LLKKALTAISILFPTFFISLNCFPVLISFALSQNFSYAAAACRLIVDSGIRLSCFLSVIGTVEHDGSTSEQQPEPNNPRNFLLFMLYIL